MQGVVRQDCTVLGADEPKEKLIGFMIRETIGVGVYNSGAFWPEDAIIIEEEKDVD